MNNILWQGNSCNLVDDISTQNLEATEQILDKSVRSSETENIVLQGEAERKKTLSDKRKRNETLAIDLSRTELLKPTSGLNLAGLAVVF